MVNLSGPNEQAARAIGEGFERSNSGPRPPRNHHNWGARFGRRREEFKNREPATLSELENLAQTSANLMSKHGGQPEKNFQISMDLLRQQYNMNFVVVCEKCKGTHMYDELMAPER